MLAPDTILRNRYKIVRKLGQGGMGAVYEAIDTTFGSTVALKETLVSGAELLKAFEREARILNRLRHTALPVVSDYFTEGDGIFLVMDFIPGDDLATLLERNGSPFSTADVLGWGDQLLNALDYLHGQEPPVIHRDIKPQNLKLKSRGEMILLDFGLAKDTPLVSLTSPPASIFGFTPHYAPLEQMQGTGTGTHSDLYALGATLYHLLTGEKPADALTRTLAVLEGRPDPLRAVNDINPLVPNAVVQALMQALTLNPDQRPQSAAEMQKQWRNARQDQEPTVVVDASSAAPGGKVESEENAGGKSEKTVGREAERMHPDPKIVERILALLREWGWVTGLEKLQAEIAATEDEAARAALQLFTAWMAGERGAHAEALKQIKEVEQIPALTGWSLVGQAFIAMRERNDALAHQLLDQAATPDNLQDRILRATIAHCRGVIHFHEGKSRLALPPLHEALELFSREHFGTGRVLDTLGMVYANKNNFQAAREFYEQAIKYKEGFDDDAGVALSHGNLGRLYLDWGNISKAERHFNKDLKIAQHIGDERGLAQIYNALGQVALARKQWDEAANWLDESIHLSHAKGWTILEGFARKDSARVSLEQSDVAGADEQAQQAEALFRSASFSEGLAHINRVRGISYRLQKNYDESERALRRALEYFNTKDEPAEAVRTQLEIARTLRAGGKPRPVVVRALLDALDRAERCRRDALVREIESELKNVDEVELHRQIYRRVRGQDVREDTISLVSGLREAATVMFLDVKDSTVYARNRDPEEVMMALNQMMADFAEVLKQHKASVTEYLGDGFMALVRGSDHARRAVTTALDLMAALKEFNRPRDVLQLKRLEVRIGIATGEVFLGNVGTYQKMNFTAIGTTANLAARLQSEAELGLPCISRETYNQLPEGRFVFKPDNPRPVKPKGLNEQQVWDVVGMEK